MARRLGVVGAGNLIEVVAALHHAANGNNLVGWSRSPASFDGVDWEPSLEAMVARVDGILIAIPGTGFESVAKVMGPFLRPEQWVVHTCRGAVDTTDGFLPHQCLKRYSAIRKVGVLGGPLYAPALGGARPVVGVVASRFAEVIEAVHQVLVNTPIRTVDSHDVTGVELCGVVAQVASIAVGLAEGLKMGPTARGLLVARGINEAARLGKVLGADDKTFRGLAAVGELIPRAVNSSLEHEHLGREFVKGHRPESELEGMLSARVLARLCDKMQLDLPMIEGLNRCLGGRLQPDEFVEKILSLPLSLGD